MRRPRFTKKRKIKQNMLVRSQGTPVPRRLYLSSRLFIQTMLRPRPRPEHEPPFLDLKDGIQCPCTTPSSVPDGPHVEDEEENRIESIMLFDTLCKISDD